MPDIPADLKRIFGWAKAHLLPIVLGLLALALAVAGVVFAINAFSGAKRATAVAQVASATQSAMTTSGADAVSAVEARGNFDQATTRIVSHAQAAVTASTDAAGADAAGRSGLCAIAADLCPAASVQQPVAR